MEAEAQPIFDEAVPDDRPAKADLTPADEMSSRTKRAESRESGRHRVKVQSHSWRAIGSKWEGSRPKG